jgi:hypothetical protein
LASWRRKGFGIAIATRITSGERDEDNYNIEGRNTVRIYEIDISMYRNIKRNTIVKM